MPTLSLLSSFFALGQPRTAAVLPPPLPNPEGGHRWYHGTLRHFDSDEERYGSDAPEGSEHHLTSPALAPPPDAGGRLEPPDRSFAPEYGYHAEHHWNTDLGTHFTSDHSVAENNFGLSHGRAYPDSRIAHCALHLGNPKHYDSEFDMTEDAIKWAHEHGHHYLSQEARDNPKVEDHLDRGGHFADVPGHEHLEYVDAHLDSQQKKAVANIDFGGTDAIGTRTEGDSYLQFHPAREEITSGFRQHLRDQGHDGVVYGNEYEGPRRHKCAIAFEPEQINMHHWEWLHPNADELHPGGRHPDDPQTPQRAMPSDALISPNYTPEHGHHWIDSDHQKVSAVHPITQQDWYHGGNLDGGKTLYDKRSYHPTNWLHVGTKDAALQRIDPHGWDGPGESDWIQHARMYRVRVAPGARVCPTIHEETGNADADDPGSLSFTGQSCGDYDVHRYINSHEDQGAISLAVRPHMVRVEEDLGRHPAWVEDPAVKEKWIADSKANSEWARDQRMSMLSQHFASGTPLYRQPRPEPDPAEYEHLDDDGRAAYFDQHRQHRNRWTREVRRAMSRGDLSPQEARAGGYHGEGHDQDNYGGLTWKKMPQTLWHVTTNKAGVMADNTLKSRQELHQNTGGSGLGGGPEDTISLTDDPEVARHIHRALHEYHGILNDRHSIPKMLEEAEQGGWLDSIHSVEGKDRVDLAAQGRVLHRLGPRTLEEAREKLGPEAEPHHGNMGPWRTPDGRDLHSEFTTPMTEDERIRTTASVYKVHAAMREHHGGPMNPGFIMNDDRALARTDPSQFGIIRVHPKPGAQGYQVSALGEWRTADGSALHIGGLESPNPHRQALVHEASRKTAKATQTGHLENPYHPHNDWYHGTIAEFEGDPHPAKAFEAMSGPGNGFGGPQTNKLLGVHFSPLHAVAHGFAGPSHGTAHGRIFHAKLKMTNPIHFANEDDLLRHVWNTTMRSDHFHDEAHDANQQWNFGAGATRAGINARLDAGQQKDRPTPISSMESYLQFHPRQKDIAEAYVNHLRYEGHDGITYGNNVEGPRLHHCAIAFDPSSIEVIHVDRMHPSGSPHRAWPEESKQAAQPREGEVAHHHIAAIHDEPQGFLDEVERYHNGGMLRSDPGLSYFDPNTGRGEYRFTAAKRQKDPADLTPDDLKFIRQQRHEIRQDAGAGGQCSFVSEALANKYGWAMHGGILHSKDGRPIGDHVWNVHEPTGTIIDATSDQHGEGHDIRVLKPTHPDYGRYRFAESNEEEERMLDQSRSIRDREGDYWWAGGIDAPAVKRYRARERKYDGGAQDSFRTAAKERVKVYRGIYLDESPEAFEGHVRRQFDPTQPVGSHWTTDPDVAKFFAGGHLRRKPGGAGIILHGEVDPEHIMNRDDIPQDRHVMGPEHFEREVHIRPGAPVDVHKTTVHWYDPGDQVALGEEPDEWEDNADEEHDPPLRVQATVLTDWKPTERLFAPTKGTVDPVLFDKARQMRPAVRDEILDVVNSFFTSHGYGDTRGWARVYLAGSQASEWWGNHDFDLLIGINYPMFRLAHPDKAGLSDEQIGHEMNLALYKEFNDEQWHPRFDPEHEWHRTGYVNKDSWDIRVIKPYAAYNVTDDTWAVDPIDEPTGHQFSPTEWYYFESIAEQARAALALPEPARSQQASRIWEFVHTDRSRAFGPHGTGLFDRGNALEKYLDQAPSDIAGKSLMEALADTRFKRGASA